MFNCLLNVEICTTNKVRNNKILSQFPALISKTNIKYDQLSEYQRKNLKENYKSSGKLISHLGYDKNSYISFEMYEISFNTISVKNQKISTNKITKNNIEFLNDKRYIKDINSNLPHTLYVE